MANSALALEKVRGHVSRSELKLRLGQVMRLREDDPSKDEIAGRGVERITNVVVDRARDGSPLDKRVFPGGVLTGTLACRAVLLEPGISARFVGEEADGALHLRTRFQYDEPGINSFPRGTALTIGGTVTHVAVHNLMPGDGKSLDGYYAAVAEYETSGLGTSPEMPALRAIYSLDAPGVPNFNKGIDSTPRAEDRLRLRRLGFDAMQDACPAARVLSVGNQGYISETELMDWAVALTGEAT